MKLVLASLAALTLAGCQTADRTNWGQVAAGTALVLGASQITEKIDPEVAKASEQLARYCPALRVVGAVAAVYTEKARAAVIQANAVVNEVCAAPPADVGAAVIVAARAYEAARAAKVTQ